jgi:hypothetical protein
MHRQGGGPDISPATSLSLSEAMKTIKSFIVRGERFRPLGFQGERLPAQHDILYLRFRVLMI